MLRIGIECESIENDSWGIARVTNKLLEEISRRPGLQNDFKFYLFFKSKIPDHPYLNNPIFEKKIIKPPLIPASFSLYYYIYLPVYLWFRKIDMMFFPNYMLPLIFRGESLVVLTEDIHYESRNSELPLRYRLAYRIFAGWAARRASRIMAISETSKRNLVKLYGIKPERINVNYLGIDIKNHKSQITNHKQIPNSKFQIPNSYLLFVGQMFPRRHAKEAILAFEKIAKEFLPILSPSEQQNRGSSISQPNQNDLGKIGTTLKFIAVGIDKYEKPIISKLVSEINKNLGREAVIHKEYVKDEELTELYSGAKVLVYVSDREAFGLPPMEALAFGVPPIVMDNELGHELFKNYAFYSKSGQVNDIKEAIKQALGDKDKIQKIKKEGPEFVRQYSWTKFTDKWIEVVNSIIKT